MTSLGELLRQTRLHKNITLDEAEKLTKIRKKFLVAIEENNWYFSSRIYVEGIVKNYAKFLGINPQKALAFFRRDYDKKEVVNFRNRVNSTFFKADREKILKIFLFTFIFLLLIYFGWQLKNYFSPPTIKIISPRETTFVNKQKVKIVGQTVPGAEIIIFGNKIYPDNNGYFNFDLPLLQEKNPIVIEVIGPNGKKNRLEKIFYRKDKD